MDSKHLSVAIEAAITGADVLQQFQSKFSVREKGSKDFVTDADLQSQKVIFELLRKEFPDEFMMGEEEGHDSAPVNEHGKIVEQPIWVVDPLDGTLNYMHRLQNYCVSIGLVQDGELQVGVVADPVCNELFAARRGEGAFVSKLDGSDRQRLTVSQCDQLQMALLACSFPAGVKSDAIEVRQFCTVLERCQALRRLGSCALNLCYVAAGRLDGYWAQSVKTWDMAAGALIVEEAGGMITAIDGQTLDVWNPKFASSATPTLHQELIQSLGTV